MIIVSGKKIFAVSKEELEDFSVEKIINGSRCFYDKNNVLHNEDGPAVIYEDGSYTWYRHGKLHRLDGPAMTWAAGANLVSWYKNGLLHRVDGPALTLRDGTNKWAVNGVVVTEEFVKALGKMK